MIADCEPEPRVSLILAQQSFGVTVYCVEGGQVSIGHCPVGSWAALTLVWVVECPHPCSIIVILTPKVFFGFKHLYISVVFFGVRLFRRLVFPHPLIVSLLLLVVGGFLGCCFLGGLLLGLLLWFVGFARSTVSLLLQRVDLRTHSDYLLLLFGGLTPGVFLIQEARFILVLGPDHEVLRCEGSPPVIALTFEVFDIRYKFLLRSSLVRLPKVVQEVDCLLFPCMQAAHLLADPLIELSDVAFEKQQLALGFD